MSEAATLLPVLTEKEHGQVLGLSSILLLGYFLPYSTGNEFVLLQGARRSDWVAETFDAADYVRNMPLEERLQKSVHSYNAGEHGEFDTLTDGSTELAMDTLLRKGLAPLLSARPFHRQEVDLLHLMAMAIHPNTCKELVAQTVHALDADKHPSWTRAQGLFQHSAALHFQLHYGHRFTLVQLLQRHLILPELEDEESDDVIGPLLFGAMPHLRASLRAFGSSARSPWEAHWAHLALVSIAVQTRHPHTVSDEWRFQLHKMVEDRSDYGCRRDCCGCTKQWQTEPPVEDTFCPHAARGQLLATFILRQCPSRHETVDDFFKHALGSLTDAIEWQVDCATVSSDGEGDEDDSERHPQCLLAALMFAVKHCFYFLPQDTKIDKDDNSHCGTLIESAIQCLQHPNVGVVKEALDLLALAFTYRPSDKFDDKYAWNLLEAIESPSLQKAARVQVEKVVAVAAQHSPSFASFLYSSLAEKSNDGQVDDITARRIALVASNCPSVVAKDTDRLVSMLEKTATTNGSFHVMAALLSLRQVRFFATKEGEPSLAVLRTLSQQSQWWDMYQLARHSLVKGSFGDAAEIYNMILTSQLKEKHFLWMSSLAKVSEAENSLSGDAAKGIPTASTLLRSAVSYLHSLGALEGNKQECYSFQIRFLLLRLDFLDLMTVLRQLTREMRLTGSGPAKYSRPHLHLQNLVKSFVALSSRYRSLNQQHGIEFQCAQSKHSLAILEKLCLFMALATRAAFSDVLPAQSDNPSITISSMLQISSQPMVLLMRRLDELVVQSMDSSMDPLVRAAAMLELIDGILMVPIPFPRDFLSVRPRTLATLCLSPDPDQAVEYGMDSMLAIEAYPSLCFGCFISGSVPESTMTGSRLPLSEVLLWYRFNYKGPLVDDEGGADFKPDEDPAASREFIEKRLPVLADLSPVTARLFANGRFFFPIQCSPLLDEGLYEVEVSLGARDVGGSMWELPVDADARTLPIRVSRSR